MKRAPRFPSRWAGWLRTLGTMAVLSVALGACNTVMGAREGTMEYPGSAAGPNAVPVYVVKDKDTVEGLSQRYSNQMATLQSFIRNSSFDGANVLDGSKPNGVSFVADADANQSIMLQGRNFMPGGQVITAPPSTTALANTQAAADTHALLEQSIANVGDQLTEMAAERKRIEAQKGFVSRLADALAAGVGGMVDTDLAAESALIQALQVKQELSASAVSIANSAPQALLSLFRA